MSKSMKNMVLLAKQEVTAGVDPVPTPAANSILARGFTPQLINAEFVERNNLRGYKGNFGQLAVGVHRVFECEVELAGSGAAGTAPKWAPLLLACGFNETISAGISAAYQPVSSGEPTITMYGYLDGLLFKLSGAKGTVSFEFNAKGIPVMKFKFIGEYQTPTDVTMPTGMVFTGFQQPLTVGKLNTPTFNIHGYAGGCSALGFDVANSLSYKEMINVSGVQSPDRKPTGSATMELPSVAAANFAELTRLGTQASLQLVHGVTAGNIIQVDMPKVQFTSAPTISNDNDVAMVGLGFSINPNTGNDEMVITVK